MNQSPARSAARESSARSAGPRINELIERVLDEGTFVPWQGTKDVRSEQVLRGSLSCSRARPHTSVLAGQGTVLGVPLALIATRFEVSGGTIGVAEAETAAKMFERAARSRLPVLGLLASGGIRVQEGTAAFVQLAKIAMSVAAFRRCSLPFVVYLAGPAFGGVMVACGALGHVTLAAPGATVGLAGPRLYEQLRGKPLAPGTHQAGHLVQRGLVDAIVNGDDLRALLPRLLGALGATVPAGRPASAGRPYSRDLAGDAPASERHQVTALAAPGRADTATIWAAIVATRQPSRVGLRELVEAAAHDVFELHGSGISEKDDPSTFLGVGRIGSVPVVIVGQDRAAEAPFPTAAGLRKARRGLLLADELRLPVVTIIDTPGPSLSERTEDDGYVFELGRCLTTFIGLEVPTLSVLLGQGTGGTALALLPADRVLCAERAWLAPLPPEGSSVILHGSPDKAAEVAATQRVGAWALLESGIADEVIRESDASAQEMIKRLAEAMSSVLASLQALDPSARRGLRTRRYRRLGQPAARRSPEAAHPAKDRTCPQERTGPR